MQPSLVSGEERSQRVHTKMKQIQTDRTRDTLKDIDTAVMRIKVYPLKAYAPSIKKIQKVQSLEKFTRYKQNVCDTMVFYIWREYSRDMILKFMSKFFSKTYPSMKCEETKSLEFMAYHHITNRIWERVQKEHPEFKIKVIKKISSL